MLGKSALDFLEISISAQGQPSLLPVTAQAHLAASDWRRLPLQWTSALQRVSSLRYTFVKRAFDIVLSLLLLVLLSPVGLLIALLVKLTSPGPVFYRQERSGRFGVPFRILKFRSMYVTPRRASVIAFTSNRRDVRQVVTVIKRTADPRITPFGRLIRRLSLDELPQLINVLGGEMSLVGPRPIVEAERAIYGHCLPYYDLVRPGITGLWQVSGRSNVGYERRVLIDRDYVSGWSCLLDLAILVRTIPAVLTMRGAY